MNLIKPILYSIIFVSLVVSSCKKKDNEEPEVITADTGYDFNDTVLTNAGWTKVFSEDFGTDYNQWNIWQGGAYNNEYQYYSATSLNISNGTLVITAKKESVTGATTNSDATQKAFDFTSGRIESKNSFSSNSTTPKIRFSARIKLPEGYGMWPAFWSYGDNWPTNGEIDALEAKGNLPYQYATNYFYGTTAGNDLVHNAEVSTVNSTTSLTDSWHVYEVIWEETKLTFLLDGKIVSTKTGTYIPSMFGKTQRIALNLAVGGAYFNNPAPSSIVTGTMYVDWVKAFSSL
jgi:beta-glucanase (GH16 family)